MTNSYLKNRINTMFSLRESQLYRNHLIINEVWSNCT